MIIRIFVLTVVAFANLTGAVMADERIFLTPPLYREQARMTAAVQPASELTTTPSLIRAGRKTSRIVAEANDSPVR